MESFAVILEEELSEAVEVKNPKSLHRYILLLSENIIGKQQYREEYTGLKGDLKEMMSLMRERFEAVDKRFEAVDKRFEAVDKRFEDMQRHMNARFEAVDKRFDDMNKRFTGLTWLISAGFVVINLLIVLFKFYFPA